MVYENIKKLADAKGMSIMEIEKRAGLGNGTIGKWRNSNPSLFSLMKVAKILNVSISTLAKA